MKKNLLHIIYFVSFMSINGMKHEVGLLKKISNKKTPFSIFVVSGLSQQAGRGLKALLQKDSVVEFSPESLYSSDKNKFQTEVQTIKSAIQRNTVRYVFSQLPQNVIAGANRLNGNYKRLPFKRIVELVNALQKDNKNMRAIIVANQVDLAFENSIGLPEQLEVLSGKKDAIALEEQLFAICINQQEEKFNCDAKLTLEMFRTLFPNKASYTLIPRWFMYAQEAAASNVREAVTEEDFKIASQRISALNNMVIQSKKSDKFLALQKFRTDVSKENPDQFFAGEVPKEMQRFLQLVLNPHKYENFVKSAKKSAIFSGPPGVGKTLMAKWLAAKSKKPLFCVRPSQLFTSFVGETSRKLDNLLDLLVEFSRVHNTEVVVFFDEIDALLQARSKGRNGADIENNKTVSAFLSRIEGIGYEKFSDSLIILAATNQYDLIDVAVRERFYKHIAFELPKQQAREQIFALHLKQVTCEKDIEKDLKGVATDTAGWSGRNIADAVKLAGEIAVEKEAECITLKHLQQAVAEIDSKREKRPSYFS